MDFPVFDKIKVNGENCSEVFKFLRFNSELHDEKTGKTHQIPWNFAKFLIGSDGKVHKFVHPRTFPDSMIPDIEKMLQA